MELQPPTLSTIAAARERLRPFLVRTPTFRWQSDLLERRLGPTTRVSVKLELWQHTGTFKVRGALLAMLELSDEARARGATAVSAGNHALAVAWAARRLDTTAKVVMPRTANPARVAGCRALGAEVVLTDDVHAAFREVERIEREEGRTFVHPFEGPTTATGTATLGLELCEQIEDLDAVIVPIGGGGLCAGVATAVKAMRPECKVYGVEPEGADTMHRSFASGKPEAIDRVRTIADSLGAPYAAPYTFGLCRRAVDALVRVSDDELLIAIARLFHGLKLAVEPAGAAATAALLGPLCERVRGNHVAVVLCGTNVDTETYRTHLARGEVLRGELDAVPAGSAQ